MGGWNENGAFQAFYDHALPVGALLGAALHFKSAHSFSDFLTSDNGPGCTAVHNAVASYCS